MELFWLEHKKLWRKKIVKICVLLCFVYSIIFGSILSFQWFGFGSSDDYTSAFGNNFDGYTVIKDSQEYALSFGGELTDETLQQIVSDYQQMEADGMVSDIEAIADEVLLMKKGKVVLQGTVPELIHKANGKVWELSVSPQEARQWQTKTTVANLRHEGKEIILRIISDNMPSERAVPCEATLEDLYLFYFPTEEGVK